MSAVPVNISWIMRGSGKLSSTLAVTGSFRKPPPAPAGADALASNVFGPLLPGLPLPFAFSITGSFRKPSPVAAGAGTLGSDVFGPLLPGLPLPLCFSITGSFRKPSPLSANVPPDLRAALGHPHPLVDAEAVLAPEDWGMHGVIRYLRAESIPTPFSGFFFTG